MTKASGKEKGNGGALSDQSAGSSSSSAGHASSYLDRRDQQEVDEENGLSHIQKVLKARSRGLDVVIKIS